MQFSQELLKLQSSPVLNICRMSDCGIDTQTHCLYSSIFIHFYPQTERFGGYSEEPGVRSFLVHSIT